MKLVPPNTSHAAPGKSAAEVVESLHEYSLLLLWFCVFGMQTLLSEPLGRGLLVVHLAVQGFEPCNALDEILEAAAGQYRYCQATCCNCQLSLQPVYCEVAAAHFPHLLRTAQLLWPFLW